MLQAGCETGLIFGLKRSVVNADAPMTERDRVALSIRGCQHGLLQHTLVKRKSTSPNTAKEPDHRTWRKHRTCSKLRLFLSQVALYNNDPAVMRENIRTIV